MAMATTALAKKGVPEDPDNPGFDVLRGELGTRTHYIHNVLADATEPLSAAEIGRRAEQLARKGGYQVNETTFAPQTTRSHLVSMRDKPGRGYAEQVEGGRWQLTERARRRIENPGWSEPPADQNGQHSAPEVRAVDAKSRLLLPKEFANATVTVERVGENEIRIRKAVVVPVDEFPFIEDQLKPLSDRDRDLFLSLLDNPPEPTPAFLKAAKRYRKRHG
jgi:hypothetical protein